MECKPTDLVSPKPLAAPRARLVIALAGWADAPTANASSGSATLIAAAAAAALILIAALYFFTKR